MKKFFGEFKTFITRGNVLDMAVGVIVGGAFTAIVNALCNHILKPIVNWILALILGEESLSSIFTYLKKVTDETGQVILEKSIYISSLESFGFWQFVKAQSMEESSWISGLATFSKAIFVLDCRTLR